MAVRGRWLKAWAGVVMAVSLVVALPGSAAAAVPSGNLTRVQQIALLESSVRDWNAWRQANPAIRPDLAGADLSDGDLTGADLADAVMYRVTMNGVHLARAVLRRADLRAARLRYVDLAHADLTGADMAFAHLFNVDLCHAPDTRRRGS